MALHNEWETDEYFDNDGHTASLRPKKGKSQAWSVEVKNISVGYGMAKQESRIVTTTATSKESAEGKVLREIFGETATLGAMVQQSSFVYDLLTKGSEFGTRNIEGRVYIYAEPT